MDMDFFKNKLARRTKAFFFQKRLLAISCAVAILMGFGTFLAFYYRHQSMTSFALATLYQAVRNDYHVDKAIEKEKSAIKHVMASGQEPVHFEFYSSLPNMKVEVADLTASSLPKDIESTAFKKGALAETKPSLKKIFNSSELEKEFSKHLAQKNYIIQLGVFNHLASAQKFSESFSQTGLKVSVISVKTKSQNNYRVQLGPFPSIQESRVAQQKLEQKQIPFLLKVVEQG